MVRIESEKCPLPIKAPDENLKSRAAVIRQQFMLTTALVVPCFLGYGGRQAYAACVNTGGSTYLCSGAEVTTQAVGVNNADVSMNVGATVDTSGGAGNAISVTGDGNLSFTNLVGGPISGALVGIYLNAGNGLAIGSLTINTAQSVTGGVDGVDARNSSTGDLIINTAAATGNTRYGIYARNFNTASSNLSITATGAVNGGAYGINAWNYGLGTLTINATDVTGNGGYGIYARNRNLTSSGDINITTTGAVNGTSFGIYAWNRGTGAITINTAAVSGISDPGLYAILGNAASTGNISITATGAVSGYGDGIRAGNYGTGGATIIATDVTATAADSRGIHATNHNFAGAGSLSITTTGTVQGGEHGINAVNNSSGNVTINVATVTATAATGAGIYGHVNNGGAASLSITATGTVSGATGIRARHDGTGALIINTASVTGTATDGIYAQRTAGAGTTITVSGAVSGARHGIATNSPGTNMINVAAGATVTGTTNAIDTTIGAAGSADTINVAAGGTITGNVDLGGGTNAFNNNAGGIFNPLATVNLGVGNTLTNAGTFSPGGTGTLQTTTLTGNFVQTAAGTLVIDVDRSVPTADKLNVSGTANVSGIVLPNLLSTSSATGQVDILTATGGVTNSGLSVTDTVAADYTLLFSDANTVALGFDLDFAPTQLSNTGFTPNQMSVGNNFNSILTAGSGNMAAIVADLAAITDITAYLAALDRLHGEHYLTQVGLLLGSTHYFTENLLSCPSRLDGAAVTTAGDHCIWGRFNGRSVNINQNSTNIGGDETSWGFSGGYEAPVREDIRVGASISIESSDFQTNNRGSSDGLRFTAGAKVERAFGALEVSAGLYGGFASYDTTRVIGLAGLGPATSDHDIGFGSVVGRISHAFEANNLRIVPMLDVAATYINYGGINETGAGAANLAIANSDEWIYSITPAIGIMGKVAETDTYKVNASLKGGVSLYSNSSIGISSSFAGAPAGAPNFTTSTVIDDVVGNLSAALEIQMMNGFSVKLGYEGRIGKTTQSHGGFARAVLAF